MRAGPLLYEHHQLYAPSNPSPPAQVSQMPLDRGCTEVQPLRDLLVAEPQHEQLQDVFLAGVILLNIAEVLSGCLGLARGMSGIVRLLHRARLSRDDVRSQDRSSSEAGAATDLLRFQAPIVSAGCGADRSSIPHESVTPLQWGKGPFYAFSLK